MIFPTSQRCIFSDQRNATEPKTSLRLSSGYLRRHQSQMILWKSTQIPFIQVRTHLNRLDIATNINPMTEPLTVWSHWSWGFWSKNFVAKWSWIRRFSDWLGFCPLLGNVNERAPSHKATFEESVIRWLPLCLLNCSRLSARCMTPCHLQGFTPGSICVSVCACARAFRKLARKGLKRSMLVLFCHFNTVVVS